MKRFYLRKLKSLVVLALTALLAACSAGLLLVHSQKSEVMADQLTEEFFLPSSNLEYFELTAPIDVYHDNGVTAIVESQELTVYKDGAFTEIGGIFSNLGQVSRFDQNTLVVSDNGSLYKIDLSTLNSKSLITYSNGGVNEAVGATYFDHNATHLVTSYSTIVFVYDFDENGVSNRREIYNASSKPVAINDNGDIYYIDNYSNLMKSSVDNTSSFTKIKDGVSISYMIANDEFLYYVSGNDVFRYGIADGATTQLTVVSDDEYDLGKLFSPSSIDFKGENLLITDSGANAVQEFKVNGNNLIFTGFAIAKNKTAYNRVKSDATAIDKYGDTLAVLDGQKLSLIDLSSENLYDKSSFNNFILSDADSPIDASVQHFALGKEYLLYSSINSVVHLVNIAETTSGIIEIDLDNYLVDDLIYQSGRYYILTHTTTEAIIFSLEEGQGNEVQPLVSVPTDGYTILTVDVFENIYLSNGTKVVRYNKSASGEFDSNAKEVLVSSTGISKISTDLIGNLLVLDVNGLNCYDHSINSLQTLSIGTNSEVIKSFALDFNTKEVFLIFQGQEYVKYSVTLPNVCIESLSLSEDEYVTSDANADVNDLKIFKAKDGANVYGMNRNGTAFTFTELIEEENEYVLIAPVTVGNEFSSATFYALAGQNHTVLINAVDAVDVTPTLETAPETVFAATGVNMYYIPLITKDGTYELGGGEIRLSKGSAISPQCKFTYLDREFYFASFKDGETTSFGYVPVEFTAIVLSEDFKWDEYTVEKLSATTLYKEDTLETALLAVEDGTQVKVISQANGIALVAVETEQGFITGYVESKFFIDQSAIAIRNALIVLAVAASVCGTTTYFVLRKKEK